MNKFCLFLLLFLSTKAYAQLITLAQAEAYGNELVKRSFLTAKGKNLLLQELKKENIEVEHPSTVNSISYTSTEISKESILQFCSDAISTEAIRRLSKGGRVDDKISPKEPSLDSSSRIYRMFDFGGRRGYEGCISSQTSVVGYTLKKTLAAFHACGLIDDKLFNDCQTALSEKEVVDEVDLLKYIVYRSSYYRFYDFNKKEQEDFIALLVQHGILTEKDALLKSYKSHELKTIPEILKHSPRYTLVDLHSYAPDPTITYPIIFEAVKKLLPGFQYSGLSVTIKEEPEDDLIKQDVNLRFSVDTPTYTHTFFHDYRKAAPTREDADNEPSRVDQDFHKGINKWLTDIESPFRLYTVNIRDREGQAYGENSVGLLLLKQGEDSLITTDPYLMSRETFDTRLSKKNIDKLLKDLYQNGFFSHLTRLEIDSAQEKIASSEINSIEDVLLQFPRMIVAFDWETGNLENPYESLTLDFMAASRGAFQLSDITDEYAKGWKKAKRVKYGFTLNGKRYEKLLPFQGDWLAPEFMELLKSALLEQKVDGNIYHCIEDGQAAGYIFLSAAQYRFIGQFYPDLLKGID